MARLFDSIQARRPGRNKFDLSHDKKMSLNMGQLIPIMMQEIVPGDSFRVRTEIMIRFAALLAPVMHRINVTTHYFFVPNRLVWDEWEDFITGGRLGTSEPVAPFIMTSDLVDGNWLAVGTLPDYLGLPLVDDSAPPAEDVKISTLPFRAYQLVYDEYYRDQNLQASLDVPKTSGDDALNTGPLMPIRYRCWEKDYFTSALPWAQRGGSVAAPMSLDPTINTVAYRPSTGLPFTQAGDLTIASDGDLLMTGSASEDGNVSLDVGGMGMNINDLRRSIRLQEWLEKNARGGARYVEQILSHFGVKSSDARLQRPEYLGGGRTPVVISEVLQTMQNETGNPLGTMGGHGVSVGTSNGFKRSFEEHGFIVGIMSVTPKPGYMQGINRTFTRFDKFDYYWPEFANIGEQEIKRKEIYYTEATTNAEQTFGYQSRYAEYKYGCNTVHGEMRTNLSFWHDARIFGTDPNLSEEFVRMDPLNDGINRIFAVTDPDFSDKLYCQLYNKIDALRPMPYFGTPTL